MPVGKLVSKFSMLPDLYRSESFDSLLEDFLTDEIEASRQLSIAFRVLETSAELLLLPRLTDLLFAVFLLVTDDEADADVRSQAEFHDGR